MLDKKGQITIFIIIGLIIVISASLLMYMVQTMEAISPEEALIPPDVKPVYDYVVNCMNVLGQEALTIMSGQGGYLNLPNTIARAPASYLPLDPAGMLKVPYWSYQWEGRIPTIPAMQNEIDQYVQEKLNFCVQDFVAFQQVTITQDQFPKANTVFTDNDVTIRLTWPLDVNFKGTDRTVNVKEYVTKIPVRYKKVYELAKLVMYAENEQEFFENMTINLFTGNKEIPFDGLELSCRPKRWRLNEIENTAQSLVRQAVSQIRIKDTVYPPFMADEGVYQSLHEEYTRIQEELEGAETLEQLQNVQFPRRGDLPRDRYSYFHYLWDVGSPRSDLKVSFDYSPAWDMQLNAHPNSNGVLSSNLMSQFPSWLKFLCINQYHFTYDIIYPVMVTVRDDKSYGGMGYNFRFAFPVLIHNNQPSRDFYSDQQFVDYSLGDEFCEEKGEDYYAIRAVGYDAYGYRDYLTDVNVSYECVGNACGLGKITAVQGTNELRTQLPSACGNPYIILTKQGYVPAKGQMTTNELELEMVKLRKLQVQFQKMPYAYFGEDNQGFRPGERLLAQDKISFYIKDKNSTHEVMFEYPSNISGNVSTIELIDDDAVYDIDVILTQFGKMIGGYHNENLTIKYADLRGAQRITFNVVESRPVAVDDPAYQTRLFDQVYSGRLNEQLDPVLS